MIRLKLILVVIITALFYADSIAAPLYSYTSTTMINYWGNTITASADFNACSGTFYNIQLEYGSEGSYMIYRVTAKNIATGSLGNFIQYPLSSGPIHVNVVTTGCECPNGGVYNGQTGECGCKENEEKINGVCVAKCILPEVRQPDNSCDTPPPACDQPGEFTANACAQFCKGDVKISDSDECSCVCGTCDEAYDAKVAACAPVLVDNKTWNNTYCTGECKQPDCQEKLDDCKALCGGAALVDSFNCDEANGNLNSNCLCKDLPPTPTPIPEPTPTPPTPPIPPVNPTPPPPVDPPDPVPVPLPPDEGIDYTNWFDAIKDTVAGLAKQVEDIGKDLKTMITNQATEAGLLSAITNNTAATVSGLQNISTKLDELKPLTEGEIEGSATLPANNVFDPAMEEMEPDTFFETISNYVTSGLPLVGYIQGTSLSISGSDSHLEVELWGEVINIEFSTYQDIFNKAGLVLIGISTIIGFFIIVGRK